MFKGVYKEEPCEGQSKRLLYDASTSPLCDLHPFLLNFLFTSRQQYSSSTCMYMIVVGTASTRIIYMILLSVLVSTKPRSLCWWFI